MACQFMPDVSDPKRPHPGMRHRRPFIPILPAAVALLLVGCRVDPATLVRPVVRLSVAGGGGSGTIIGRTGHTYLVLTAGHVVIPPRPNIVVVPTHPAQPTLLVDVFDPDELSRPARVLRASLHPDLALLEVELATPRDPMRVSVRGPRPGQRVLAAGCPGGIRTWWTTGFVVGTGYELFPRGTWGINASIASGASGGPVIDLDTGELVGVVSGGLLMRSGPFSASPVPGVGAMVPSDRVVQWLHGSPRWTADPGKRGGKVTEACR